MWEVEVKVRARHAPVEARLQELGAAPIGEAVQRDTYYAHPCRDLASGDEALRLREQGEPTELTYKGPRLPGRTKSRQEVTLVLQDAVAARELLARLGFIPAAVVEKRRRVFHYADAVVCLDEVAGLGEFVEVEVHPMGGEAQARLDDVQQRALALLGELGLLRETETRSYLEMLLATRGNE